MLNWFKRILTPPIFPDDEDKTSIARFLYILSGLTAVMLAFYAVVLPLVAPQLLSREILIAGLIAAQIVQLILIRRGHVQFSGAFTIGIFWIFFAINSVVNGGVRTAIFGGNVLLVLVTAILYGQRAAFSIAFLSVLEGLALVWAESQGLLPPIATTSESALVTQAVLLIVGAGILHFATLNVNAALRRARHELNERKRVELEREQLIQELESRNAELERFTYMVSHDLKSPIVTVRGFLGYLEADVLGGNLERAKTDVQRIITATDKMQMLLNDVLELSRIGRLMNPPVEVALTEIVHEALENVDSRLARSVIAVKIDPNLPHVYGDRLRLMEVMQNLIDNAAKFMGDQPRPQIEIGVRSAGAGPIFFVRDNGLGIDPRYHEKVFDLFDKLDPSTDGTGIGLALVKRIIELHGGRIWVESEGHGHGSTFCFTLGQQPPA